MLIKNSKALTCIFCLLAAFYGHAQIFNYNPPPNIQKIAAGSLVIGMDNATQSLDSEFNLKAYGLVNYLLKNGVPVYWIVRSNKTNTADADLFVQAQRELPSSLPEAPYSFASGPFVIDSSLAAKAIPLIQKYGNGVNVYRTKSATYGDVQYTLTQNPKVAVLTDGGNPFFHKTILDNAGFTTADYDLISAKSLSASTCYTLASESDDPNNLIADTTYTNPVKRFVESGGNFFAQYQAILSYENMNHFVSPYNLSGSVNNAMSIKNPNHPFIQVDGSILNAPGAVKTITLPIGAVFYAYTYSVIDDNSGPAPNYKAITRKVSYTFTGGQVFYFAGQTSAYTWSGNNSKNAYRMYLNAVMMPAQRKSYCSQTDIRLQAFANKSTLCTNDTVTIKVAAANLGMIPGSNVQIKEGALPGLSFLSADSSTGTFNSADGSWTISSLNYGDSDTLYLTCKATYPGNINVKFYSTKSNWDNNQQNDTTAIPLNVQTLPSVYAGKDTALCQGSALTLGSDSVAGNSYRWYSKDGLFVSGNAHLIIRPGAGVTYILSKTNQTSGCTSSDTVQVSVKEAPFAELGPDKALCAGDSVHIDLPVAQGTTVKWYSEPATMAPTTGFSIGFVPDMSMKLYSRMTETSAGCSSLDSINIILSTPPSASSIISGDTNTFHHYAAVVANPPVHGTGAWSVAAGSGHVEDATSASTRVVDLNPGINVLRWTVTSGTCPPSFEDITITVKQLNIPQGVSPNGDGINDIFLVEGIEEFPESKLEILTRWGELVYSEENYNNNWKGQNSQGEALPDDTYYYILQLPEGMTYKSYVLLKR